MGYVSPLGTFALKEKKLPIVNNQCVVYKFECDLCDADYVGYTARVHEQRCGQREQLCAPRTLLRGHNRPLDPLRNYIVCTNLCFWSISISQLITKITISSIVIGLKNSYFPLIHSPSCYRTVQQTNDI